VPRGGRCCRWIRACAPPQARPSGSETREPGDLDRRPGRDDQPGAGDGRRRSSPGRAGAWSWSCRGDDLAGSAVSLGKTPSMAAAVSLAWQPAEAGEPAVVRSPSPVAWPARRPKPSAHVPRIHASTMLATSDIRSGTQRRAGVADPRVAERLAAAAGRQGGWVRRGRAGGSR